MQFCQLYDDAVEYQMTVASFPMTPVPVGSVNEQHIYVSSAPRLDDPLFVIFRLDKDSIDMSGNTKYRFTLTNDTNNMRIGVYFPEMLYIPDPAFGDGLYIPCVLPGMGCEFFSFYDNTINKLCWGIRGDSTNTSPNMFSLDGDLFEINQ